MRLLKLLGTLLMLIASTTTCYAASYRLKITDSADNIHYFELDNNLRLEVEGEALKVISTAGPTDLLLTDLKGFAYEQSPSGLETAKSGYFRLTPDGIVFTAPDNATRGYAVFGASGTKVCGGEFRDSLRIEFSLLPPGVYILSLEGQPPLKFAVL